MLRSEGMERGVFIGFSVLLLQVRTLKLSNMSCKNMNVQGNGEFLSFFF